METKICSRCKRELPVSQYYSRGNGKLRSECKECHKGYVKSKYQERKGAIGEVKASIGCAKCGDIRSYVLDFHHRNGEEKVETINHMIKSASAQTLQKELEKCDVLCANCHREFHYLNLRNQIDYEEYLCLDSPVGRAQD